MKRAYTGLFSALIGIAIFIAPTSQANAETITDILISFADDADHRHVIDEYAKSSSDPRVRKDVLKPDRCAILLMNEQFKSLNSTHPQFLGKFLNMYIPRFLDRAACSVDGSYLRSKSAKREYRNDYDIGDTDERMRKLDSLKERGLISDKDYQEKKQAIAKDALNKL